jgi:twitching motility protein PilI
MDAAILFEALRSYERRSLDHDPGVPEELEAAGSLRAIAFRCGAMQLLGTVNDVFEVLMPPPVTQVPGAKVWLLGVANVRGTLMGVVDLRAFLEGHRTMMSKRCRVLAVRQAGAPVGFLVDEVFGQRTVNDSMTDQGVELLDTPIGQYLNGCYRADGNLWGVVDMGAVAKSQPILEAAV